MALDRKLTTGISRLALSIATNEEGIRTTTETWVGPHAELVIKQNAVAAAAKGTTLTPTDAGDGQLTVTYEAVITYPETPPDVLELVWQELRKPVEEHPFFDELDADEKKEVKRIAEDPEATISEVSAATGAFELYGLLAAGTTEYAIGVPVVRRTRTRRSAPGGGGSWMREDPPELAPAGYEWLKTANETRKEGKTYTHTEEWTGARKWDVTLYGPAT